MKAAEVECSNCGVGPGVPCRLSARAGKPCRVRVRYARIKTGVETHLRVKSAAEAKAACDAAIAQLHATDETCGTCGGEGVLVGTEHDGRGGDRDVIEPCPDCTSDYFNERDPRELAFAEPAWMSGRV
jgi:hypothetical protein